MDIDHFIQELADGAQPVARPLAPWRGATLWLEPMMLSARVGQRDIPTGLPHHPACEIRAPSTS